MSSLQSAAPCGQDAPRLYVPPARQRKGAKPRDIELAALIRAGDQDALYELVMSVRGLIGNFVRYYGPRCSSFTARDLFQEGFLAATVAARRYDPIAHDVRFTTYAYHALGWRFCRIAYVRDQMVRHPPTGEPLARAAFDYDLADHYASEPDPWEYERELLPELLLRFPERTQRLFELRKQGRTLEEIGREIGVTKERVRQIEAKAIRRMRERISKGISTNGE